MKKIQKLLCLVLSASMVSPFCGIPVYAAEETGNEVLIDDSATDNSEESNPREIVNEIETDESFVYEQKDSDSVDDDSEINSESFKIKLFY